MRTSPSSCTKGRGSTRPPSATTWGRGEASPDEGSRAVWSGALACSSLQGEFCPEAAESWGTVAGVPEVWGQRNVGLFLLCVEPAGPQDSAWKVPGGAGRCGFSGSGSDFRSPPPSFVFPVRDEFNIQVLHAFVELHEFTDLNLVQALR